MPNFSQQPSEETHELDIKNVLLLDDDDELAETLKRLIESQNYIVTTVKNGVDGLREVMEMDFDVIICDLLMPTMPGDMFYLAVKKVRPHLCERFLFLTGQGQDFRVRDFIASTEGLAIFKPAPAEQLLQMIQLVLRRQKV